MDTVYRSSLRRIGLTLLHVLPVCRHSATIFFVHRYLHLTCAVLWIMLTTFVLSIFVLFIILSVSKSNIVVSILSFVSECFVWSRFQPVRHHRQLTLLENILLWADQ